VSICWGVPHPLSVGPVALVGRPRSRRRSRISDLKVDSAVTGAVGIARTRSELRRPLDHVVHPGYALPMTKEFGAYEMVATLVTLSYCAACAGKTGPATWWPGGTRSPSPPRSAAAVFDPSMSRSRLVLFCGSCEVRTTAAVRVRGSVPDTPAQIVVPLWINVPSVHPPLS